MCCTNADYIAFLKTIFTRILGCLPRVCLRLTSTMSGNIQKCLRTSSPVALFIYSFIFIDLRYTMFLNQHKYTWSCKKIVFTYCLTTRLYKNKPLAQKKSHHDFPFHTSVLIGALVYHKALRTMCTFKEISVRIYYSLNKKKYIQRQILKLWRIWNRRKIRASWWRHQMETFPALLAICVGNSPVTGDFPAQRPVMRTFGVFFDLRLTNWLSKQWWGWRFETPWRPLWRHCNLPFTFYP